MTEASKPTASRNCSDNMDIKESDLNVRLISVGEVDGATVINRRVAKLSVGKPVSVDMSVRVLPDLDHSTVSLVVSTSYIYEGIMIRERVMSCSAIACFEIERLRDHVEMQGEEVIVGGRLMMLMLGVAVGALRGIVSVRTSGTPLAGRPLPILDLSALMYRLRYGTKAPQFRT